MDDTWSKIIEFLGYHNVSRSMKKYFLIHKTMNAFGTYIVFSAFVAFWRKIREKKALIAKGARGQKTYFGNQSCAMFWQQTIGHIAMLITNGSNYVFRLFSHLIQKQIHNTKTSFSDMSSFFWAEFVCNLGKMTAYEWKGNNVTILGREFQAHLEMVLKKSGIKAKQWQVWCVY